MEVGAACEDDDPKSARWHHAPRRPEHRPCPSAPACSPRCRRPRPPVHEELAVEGRGGARLALSPGPASLLHRSTVINSTKSTPFNQGCSRHAPGQGPSEGMYRLHRKQVSSRKCRRRWLPSSTPVFTSRKKSGEAAAFTLYIDSTTYLVASSELEIACDQYYTCI